jgi:hypothetical protein
MKLTRRIILISLLALVVGGLVFYLSRPEEPKYRGLTVKEWLVDWVPNGSNAAATEAILALGTNAIPGLLQELGVTGPNFDSNLKNFLERLPILRMIFTGNLRQQKTAAEAIRVLGEDGKAQSAIASIIQCLQKEKSGRLRYFLIHALGRIGPPAKEAVPLLVTLLQDKETNVRSFVAASLGQIKQQPQLVVPALLTALNQKDGDSKGSYAYALGQFEEDAQAAVPTLLALSTNSSDAWVRTCATEALRLIDTATADNVRIK